MKTEVHLFNMTFHAAPTPVINIHTILPRVCKLGVFLATWDIFCNASVPGAVVPSVNVPSTPSTDIKTYRLYQKGRKRKKKKEKKGKPATPQPSLDTSIQTLLDFPTK